jgi:hypothetical protein
MPVKQEPGEALQTALAKLGQPKKPIKPKAAAPKKKPAAKKPAADPHSLDATQAAFEKLTTRSAKNRAVATRNPKDGPTSKDIQRGAKDAAKMTKKLGVKPAAVTIAKAPKEAVK